MTVASEEIDSRILSVSSLKRLIVNWEVWCWVCWGMEVRVEVRWWRMALMRLWASGVGVERELVDIRCSMKEVLRVFVDVLPLLDLFPRFTITRTVAGSASLML